MPAAGPDQASDLLKLLKDIPQPDSKLRKPTPLHMAVRCGRTDLFPLVIDHRAGDLNIRDSAGQTPAHIASALGRSDLIKQLLAHPGIDDSIRDDQGRTCFDLAATPEVSRLIQASHSHLNATFLDHLAAYVSSGQTDGLVPMLRQPRAKCIDFSNRTHTSPHAGTTIMHEAARRKDIDMLRLSHDKGADVLVRDARGKTPVDYAKDDKTRAWFKQVMIAEGKALRGHSIDLNTTSSSNLSQMSSSFASAKAPPPRRG